MKNTANRTIPGTLSVGQSDPVIVCLEHLSDVEVGGTYLIMLLPQQTGVFGGAYRFAEYNSQVSWDTWDEFNRLHFRHKILSVIGDE